MNRWCVTFLGSSIGLVLWTGNVMAIEVDSSSNRVFDLYYFGNDEVGLFGSLTGNEIMDTARQTSGHVSDSSTYYWNDSMKQAMVNAVNTWTTAITNPYDTTKHARKLRIGFFLDDASTSGGVMSISMAGYASKQSVTTNFESQYGTNVNIYSVAEWAWRDNNETAYYKPSWVQDGYYWETNILSNETNSIDIAIVLNPVVTSYGWDANGQYYYNKTARSIQEMQNVALHEIGHGLGMNSALYTQTTASDGSSTTMLSGYVSTWDSLVTLNGENIVTVQDGSINAQYATLKDLHDVGWECADGLDPTKNESYTGDEIQYDPNRRLSLNGEVGVFISALLLEGDTLEHLSYDNGENVLGPGGTVNAEFSESDLHALELLGWSVNRDLVPEPTSGVFALFGALAGVFRRRRNLS